MEDKSHVIDNQIEALILEDLAFPLRHNNALCVALPVSQAWEEGNGRLSHGSHRFLPSPLPPLPAPKTSDSVVSFTGKDDCTVSIPAGCTGAIFSLKLER